MGDIQGNAGNKGDSKSRHRLDTLREQKQEPPPVGYIARIETRTETRTEAKTETRTGARPEARAGTRTETRAATVSGDGCHCGGCSSFGGWRLSVPPFEAFTGRLSASLSFLSFSLKLSITFITLYIIIIIL